ncbi:MAG: family 78 glycoside hydrolase catalytic domain [Hyphomonadaceae bacterium]|nr:family 78 glycoside hydrolase catalytic domain [Hyphomonadaceae bacterium]
MRVSADNRFVLYVNGVRVAAGPARGDLAHWRYETVDLAPHMRRGANVVAAIVWNDSRFAPVAQISARTGFWIEAVDAAQVEIDSGARWRTQIDRSRTTSDGMPALVRAVGLTYYIAGPPETHDGAARNWQWQSESLGESWTAATPLQDATAWTLIADPLPAMRFELARQGRVVRSDLADASRFPQHALVIPANTNGRLLIDMARVLAAYPELTVSGGAGAQIKLTYTEALYDAQRQRLGDRAAVGDLRALGLSDIFLPDGGDNRVFGPLWWRGWRFVELEVQTADTPLRLERFDAFETGYPFEQRARFESNDDQLNEIWRIGWSTVQFDAHETYMDTAYWEQLQYIGDTRIQALITYAVTGDPRLPAQALDAFDSSRSVAGPLPQSAYPSRTENLIPPFALLWIGMLHDFWMHQPDESVVRRNLFGAREVLDWYASHVGADNLVGQIPGWNFIDWKDGLSGRDAMARTQPPATCVISLLYLGALDQMMMLERAVGEVSRAENFQAQSQRVRSGVQSQCWDEARGLYADTPAKNSFSQHANALAVLYDVAPAERQHAILARIVADERGNAPPDGVTGATYYFSWYLVRAFEHAGLADRYLDFLTTWRELLAKNFTTWPEMPDPSRSDSHAWSGHPTADLLGIVAGITPAAPGFARVRVAPHLGVLTSLDADMPHPNGGLIRVSYRRRGGNLNATINLPQGLEGEFEWRGETRPLSAGRNQLRFR